MSTPTLANPIGSGLIPGRIDQGKDYSGRGVVGAIGAGTITHLGLWPGWGGALRGTKGGGIVYKLDRPFTYKGLKVERIFIQENFLPGSKLKVGQHIQAGQALGLATGGPSGIETGLANADSSGPLIRYNGDPDGTPERGGKVFAELAAALKSSHLKAGGLVDTGSTGQAAATTSGNGPLGIGNLDPSGLVSGAGDAVGAVASAGASAASDVAKAVWDALFGGIVQHGKYAAVALFTVLLGAGLFAFGLVRAAGLHHPQGAVS